MFRSPSLVLSYLLLIVFALFYFLTWKSHRGGTCVFRSGTPVDGLSVVSLVSFCWMLLTFSLVVLPFRLPKLSLQGVVGASLMMPYHMSEVSLYLPRTIYFSSFACYVLNKVTYSETKNSQEVVGGARL